MLLFLMLMLVLMPCIDFDCFRVELNKLVSFVVLVGAACKGAAIRGLLSTCKAQRKAAGNRAPLRGQNPAPEVPGSQSLAQEAPGCQNPAPKFPRSQNLALERKHQEARIQPRKPRRPESSPKPPKTARWQQKPRCRRKGT